MNWLIKAGIQRALSFLPNSHSWNLFFQRKVTRSLPISDAVFIERLGYARERIALFQRFSTKPLSEVSAFELGAGWDLEGPLAFSAMGVGKQRVVDIVRGAKIEFVNDLIEKFSRVDLAPWLGASAKFSIKSMIHSLHELEKGCGITYAAPSDARSTGLPDESIDLISTNSTFEHIPKSSLESILKECHRILHPDGLMVHFIDMKDHFSYFDSSISQYNFLSLPDWLWSIVNSDLQYQNRLRRSDYLAMFEASCFEIVHEETRMPTQEERTALRKLALEPQFQSYSEDDLSAQVLGVVLRKK